MDPLKPVVDFLAPWSTGLVVVGIALLGMCGVLVGVKMGFRSAGARKGENGMREGLGSLAGVVLGGIILGGAVIAVGIAVKIGQGAGTV